MIIYYIFPKDRRKDFECFFYHFLIAMNKYWTKKRQLNKEFLFPFLAVCRDVAHGEENAW